MSKTNSKTPLEIIKTITLLRGDKVDVVVCRGFHISYAMNRMVAYNERYKSNFDLTIFLMVELCIINGNTKGIEYYADLLNDDYMSIFEAITDVLETIK